MIIPCEPRERRFEAVTEVCVMTINSKDRSTLGQFEAHFLARDNSKLLERQKVRTPTSLNRELMWIFRQ